MFIGRIYTYCTEVARILPSARGGEYLQIQFPGENMKPGKKKCTVNVKRKEERSMQNEN
jgi:hypothetical protein